MPSSPSDVAVVILNWNGGDLVAKAVRSALEQHTRPAEIVVVDNGSVDGSDAAVDVDGVDVVRLGTNTGYAAGMNLGVAHTTASTIVLMNCDAILHPSFTTVASAALARHARVGVLGANVVRVAPDGEGRFWEERGPWTADGGVLGVSRDMRVRKLARMDAGPTFKPNGACPVLRRAVVDDLATDYGDGPFDPVFDTYGEDIDFAFKVWRAGWEIRFEPTLLAGHVRSYGSSERVFDKQGRLRANIVAGRHVNAWRHAPARELVLAAPMLLVEDVALAARGVVRGDRSAVADVAAAWRRVWRQRRDLAVFRRRHRPAHAPLGWAGRVGAVPPITALPEN